MFNKPYLYMTHFERTFAENYIDGRYLTHSDENQKINPSTEEVIGLFPQSSKGNVDDAVAAARKAFKTWRQLSRVQRAEYFDRLAQLIKRDTEKIANIISLETGKNINESIAEVNEALHMVQFTFGKGREPYGNVIASEIPERDVYMLTKPKGIVAVVAPWNFPFAIGGFWCASPALLEGNTVILKPSEDAPFTAQITADLFHEAGFPPGTFNVIYGDGEVGKMLVESEIDHVCFTGSAEVGRSIRIACANSWTKTASCEMGSKSALVIFDDCNMDLALSASLASAFKLSGQRCVSAGRLLVQRSIYDTFIDKFMNLARGVQAVDPFGSQPEANLVMGPLINKTQMERVVSFNEMAHKDITHVKIAQYGGRIGNKGYFISPYVYGCEWADKPYLKQEVFGPHVAIIPFDNLDHAVEIYNDTDYGLSIGVLTEDFRKAREVRDRCDFGLGYWNNGCIGAESHNVFGGVKKSGNGWPSAAGSFDAVSHKIAWSVNHGGLNFPQGMKA